MDIAGVVVDAGSSTRFSIGDHIIASGAVGYSEGCSFQTHVLVDEDCCAKGANGSVGKFAIQLAKISGFTAIAVTSSQSSTTEVEARGADFVFSNDDADVVSKIQAAAPQLQYAFDTVVTEETIGKVVQCLSTGGTIATAIELLGEPPNKVQFNSVFSAEVFGKTMFGQESPRGKTLGTWLWSNVSPWLGDGQLKPLEFENIGNLSDIETGLKRMSEGKVKLKLVAETK